MSDESTEQPGDDIELIAEYEGAFAEWRRTEDAELWDGIVGDGR